MKKIFFLLLVIATCSSFQKKKPQPVIPACIKQKIAVYKKMQQHEQPQSVAEYEYKGKKVYYIKMPCCDFFNELYDSNCQLLGHPDGGMTGRGDGKLPDFNTTKKKEKIIWQVSK
jgi:hypothetical protein